MDRNTKWVIVVMFVVVVVITFIIVAAYNFDKQRLEEFCESKNVTEQCKIMSLNAVLCYADCRDLGLEYFRYDGSGLGISECWCKKNQEAKQVW